MSHSYKDIKNKDRHIIDRFPIYKNQHKTEKRPVARLHNHPVSVNVSDLGKSHAEEALLQ